MKTCLICLSIYLIAICTLTKESIPTNINNNTIATETLSAFENSEKEKVDTNKTLSESIKILND